MDNDEWDLMSIVNSCKATTFTNPTIIFETSPSPQTPITITTNNTITPQNTTPSHFNDFTVIEENNPTPFTPQKPIDFIDLEKLRINFNHNNTHPIPTTIIPHPTTITTTPTTSSPISITTTLTSLTTTIPTYITTTPFDRVYNHQSVRQQPPKQQNQLPIRLPQTPIIITTTTTNNIIPTQNTTSSYFKEFTVIQENNSVPSIPLKPTAFTDLENLRVNFNHSSTLPIPTTMIPIVTTITTCTTSIPTILTTTTSSPITTIPTPISLTTTIPTYSTIVRADHAHNHSSIPEQPQRQHNQLQIVLPQTPITTNTTTNNFTSPQNTTPSYFDNFTFVQENNSVPLAPLKPTDFVDLDKLRINFNHNTTLPTTTTIIPSLATMTTPTTSIPTILTTTTSSPITTTTTPTSLTTTIPTIPTYITTTHANNQLQLLLPQIPITTTSTNNTRSPQNTAPSYFDSFSFIQENNYVTLSPLEPTEFVDIDKLRSTFNHNTTLPTATTNITNPITIKTPTISIPTLISTTTTTTTTITSNPISTATIPASSTTTIHTQNTTSHFDLGYNHPLVLQQTPRQCDQLPNLLPRPSSRVLPNTYPQQPKSKSRKRKNCNEWSLECHVKEDDLSKDWWRWRKYGQKFIKGSPHPRSYYKCSSKDCLARKVVEKSNTMRNTYVVTYIEGHNHEKPVVNQRSRWLSYQSSQSSQMGEN